YDEHCVSGDLPKGRRLALSRQRRDEHVPFRLVELVDEAIARQPVWIANVRPERRVRSEPFNFARGARDRVDIPGAVAGARKQTPVAVRHPAGGVRRLIGFENDLHGTAACRHDADVVATFRTVGHLDGDPFVIARESTEAHVLRTSRHHLPRARVRLLTIELTSIFGNVVKERGATVARPGNLRGAWWQFA